MSARTTTTKITIGATPAPLDPPGVSQADGAAFYKPSGGPLMGSVNGAPWAPVNLSGSIVVEDIAALEAYAVHGLADGTTASMASLLDFWTLGSSLAAPDGITVVQASDGVRVWTRACVPHLTWSRQTDWWVDPAAGDDEAPGDDVATPIRTVDEIRRRVGQLPVEQITAIHPLGDLPAIVLDFNTSTEAGAPIGAIVLMGQKTQAARAQITAVVAHNNATQTVGTITADGDISAQRGRRLLVVEDGTAAGAVSWHLGQPAGGGTDEAITGPFQEGDTFAEVAPTVGATVGFYDLTKVAGITATCSLLVEDCELTGPSVGAMTLRRCLINDTCQLTSAEAFDSSLEACCVGSNVIVEALGRVFLRGVKSFGRLTTFRGGYLEVLRQQTALCSGELLTGVSPAPASFVVRGSASEVAGALCFCNHVATASCVVAQGGAVLRVGRGFLWGADITGGGAGVVIDARAGSLVTYSGTSPPVFGPNVAISVGGVADVIASLPVTTAANFAGIVVDA